MSNNSNQGNNPPANNSTTDPVLTQGTARLKNIGDLSDDTFVYDSVYENPISFVKKITQHIATPNIFRTKSHFYGRFLTMLYKDGSGGKTGSSMWDPILASMARSGGESAGLAQMKLFVCIVHIEELHHDPMPANEDWDSMRKIATNGGIFKSYTYTGQIPNYGDPVLVTYGDLATRTEGMFLEPLVGGASGAPIGMAGGIGGYTGGFGGGGSMNFLNDCFKSPGAGVALGSPPQVPGEAMTRSQTNKTVQQQQAACPDGSAGTGRRNDGSIICPGDNFNSGDNATVASGS